MAPAKHGTRSMYSHAACRCNACRKANAEYQSERNALRRGLLEDGLVEVHHGTVATYQNWGCRCRRCTDAQAAASHRYYHRPLIWTAPQNGGAANTETQEHHG